MGADRLEFEYEDLIRTDIIILNYIKRSGNEGEFEYEDSIREALKKPFSLHSYFVYILRLFYTNILGLKAAHIYQHSPPITYTFELSKYISIVVNVRENILTIEITLFRLPYKDMTFNPSMCVFFLSWNVVCIFPPLNLDKKVMEEFTLERSR